jgi:hypothetical protein
LPIVDAHGNQVLLPVVADFEIAPGRAVWQPSARLDANLGGLARITGYDVSAAGVTPGDEWQLHLYWQTLALMEKDYTVFVHVVDEAGRIVAQTHVPPARGFHPTSRWGTGASLRDSYRLTIPEETPPGDYYIRVGLYDPVTGARLSLLDAAGQPVDNEVNVTQLHIDRP